MIMGWMEVRENKYPTKWGSLAFLDTGRNYVGAEKLSTNK